MKMFGVITGGLILTATAAGVYLWRRRRKIAAEAEQAARDAAAVIVNDVKAATRNLPQIQDVFRDELDRSMAATMSAVPALMSQTITLRKTPATPKARVCDAALAEWQRAPDGVARDIAEYRINILGC